jgi:hypothetical protein
MPQVEGLRHDTLPQRGKRIMKRTFEVEGWETDWKIEWFPSPETLIDRCREGVRSNISHAATEYEKMKSFTDRDCLVEDWIRDCERKRHLCDFQYDIRMVVLDKIMEMNPIPWEEVIKDHTIYELYELDEDFKKIVDDICNEIWLVLAKEPVGVI